MCLRLYFLRARLDGNPWHGSLDSAHGPLMGELPGGDCAGLRGHLHAVGGGVPRRDLLRRAVLVEPRHRLHLPRGHCAPVRAYQGG